MKNKALFNVALCAALLSPLFSQAQSVGIGTTTPDPSAALDVSATNKGLLIPRVTFSNRPASPVAGLMIYQTDNTPGFYTYDGTAWNRMLSTAGAVPGSIASVTPINGAVGPIAANSGVLVFAGPTVTVNVTSSSQKLVGSIGAPLGLSAASTSNIEIGMCYQSTTGGTVTNFAGTNYFFVQMSTDRKLYTVNATVSGLAPGTYTIGFGVRNYSLSNINNNDYANGYVMLIN